MNNKENLPFFSKNIIYQCRMGCSDSKSINIVYLPSPVIRVSHNSDSPSIDIGQSISTWTIKNFKQHYQLVSLLGMGDFSKVFKTKHLQSGHLRAIKVTEKKQLRLSQTRRIWKQIGILKSVDHNHIIKAYQAFSDETKYYQVVELCEGGQLLKRILAGGEMPNSERLRRIMRQLISAVSYCHRQNIIHRNVRPQSILLTGDSEWCIKLAGFFYAIRKNQLMGDDPILTEISPPKTCFTAPQCAKFGYSIKSDIWACGMFLYLLITGYAPHDQSSIIRKAREKQGNCNRIGYITTFKTSDLEFIENTTARSLLQRMLNNNPQSRPTTQQCMQHPFLSNTQPTQMRATKDSMLVVMDKLRRFHVNNVLENFIMVYNCHHLSSIQQKDEYLKEFEGIDTNSDGFVTREQLLNALISFGVERDKALQQTDDIFQTIDLNYNGVIDYSEYVMATMLSDRRANDQDLQSMFKLINTNNKVALDIQDISHILSKKQTARFINQLAKQNSQIKSKTVNLQQFKNVMKALLKTKGRLSADQPISE